MLDSAPVTSSPHHFITSYGLCMARCMDDIADVKTRAFPGDTEKGEIAIVRAGTFDENGLHVQLLEDEVELPGGKKTTLPRLTRSPHAPDGVVVVPITEDD